MRRRDRRVHRLLAGGGMIALVLLLGGVTTASAPVAALTPSEDVPVLRPTEDQSLTSRTILYNLRRWHYRNVEIDDEFSRLVLADLLKALDPARFIFLKSDIDEFHRLDSILDDTLKEGDLDPVYLIFNQFQGRRTNRIHFLQHLLETQLDSLTFDGEDTLEVVRDEAPWPANEAEWDQLWSARFKNDVLSLRLAGRGSEEIREVLERRYADQLRRALQFQSKDVFRIFMNVVSGYYEPHTEYFPPQEAENFDIHMSLSFEGIGALLGTEGEYCQIERILPGGPAERGGELKATDRIIAVGQGDEGEMVDVIGWRVDEIVDLIRGPKDSRVRLSILPSNQTDSSAARIVVITRDQVKLEEQEAQSRIIDVGEGERSLKVGVIELPTFYMDFEAAQRGDPDFKSSTRDVEKLVRKLQQEGVQGIVMDLRYNGGGSLWEAHELASLFLGNSPVVQIRDAAGQVEVLGGERPAPIWDGPLVVVVNRLSASASEIFAAAVQDTGRGLIVGSRTFGKGTVQGLLPIDRGQLKLTQAKFYRLEGGSTQNQGVVPDVTFPSLYDENEVGESSLDYALPWDRIDPVKRERTADLIQVKAQVVKEHEARAGQSPDFEYLRDWTRYAAAQRASKVLSLNQHRRETEREQANAELLKIENRRRAGLGKEPAADLEQLDELQRSESKEDLPDFELLESGRILSDFVALTRKARLAEAR